jgi:D-glycero-beta-D-manno-heptose 1-phosphate adenylyltransferase
MRASDKNSQVNFEQKIICRTDLPSWRAKVRASGRRLVVTNGCFDLLHRGHVTYLQAARQQGDMLLVGLNSDNSVRELKGNDRPINIEADRAAVLAALESVDAVCIFEEKSAQKFIELAQPDIYVKGGDYTVDTLNQEERRTVESGGGKVLVLPIVPGKSTTALLKKLSSL